IPVHLLTREALRLYFDMLAPRGILALHISNRYLRLEPVVANLAEDGHYARMLENGDTGDIRGGVEATWVVLARRQEDFGELASDPRWTETRLEPDARVRTWSDDFHNLISAFQWCGSGSAGRAGSRGARSAPARPCPRGPGARRPRRGTARALACDSPRSRAAGAGRRAGRASSRPGRCCRR